MSTGISVVVPVYNGETFLFQCLQSLAQSENVELQVIVVDDGSKDDSINIAKLFCKENSNFIVIEHGMNLGLPAALNSGLSASTQEWSTWISHDNYVGRSCYRELLSSGVANKADVVYGDYYLIDNNSQVFGTGITENSDFIYCGNVIGANFLYRTSIAKDIGGYDTAKFLYEDYDFFLKLKIAKAKFHRTHKLEYFYRMHNQQLTSTHSLPKDYFKWRLSVLKNAKEIEPEVFARASVSLVKDCVSKRHIDFVMTLIPFLFRYPLHVLRYSMTKTIERIRI